MNKNEVFLYCIIFTKKKIALMFSLLIALFTFIYFSKFICVFMFIIFTTPYNKIDSSDIIYNCIFSFYFL